MWKTILIFLYISHPLKSSIPLPSNLSNKALTRKSYNIFINPYIYTIFYVRSMSLRSQVELHVDLLMSLERLKFIYNLYILLKFQKICGTNCYNILNIYENFIKKCEGCISVDLKIKIKSRDKKTKDKIYANYRDKNIFNHLYLY
jgi:hypothetical protein